MHRLPPIAKHKKTVAREDARGAEVTHTRARTAFSPQEKKKKIQQTQLLQCGLADKIKCAAFHESWSRLISLGILQTSSVPLPQISNEKRSPVDPHAHSTLSCFVPTWKAKQTLQVVTRCLFSFPSSKKRAFIKWHTLISCSHSVAQ